MTKILMKSKTTTEVPNLHFISKLIEKVVLSRINDHLDKSNFNQPFPSPYRKFHCTETSLLKVHRDLASSTEKTNVAVLLGLVLSAAFDTIDGSIMFNWLADTFRVHAMALSWCRRYITNRKQVIKVSGAYFSRPNYRSACRKAVF